MSRVFFISVFGQRQRRGKRLPESAASVGGAGNGVNLGVLRPYRLRPKNRHGLTADVAGSAPVVWVLQKSDIRDFAARDGHLNFDVAVIGVRRVAGVDAVGVLSGGFRFGDCRRGRDFSSLLYRRF